MKNGKILWALLALFLISCGDEPETPLMICNQNDWVGVYTGTEECGEEIPDFIPFDQTITMGATDDEIIFDGVATKFDNCEATITKFDSVANSDKTTVLTLLPGDSISIVSTVMPPDITFSISCRFIGGK